MKKNMLLIFIGGPQTGKTVLANMIDENKNIRIIDEFVSDKENAKKLIVELWEEVQDTIIFMRPYKEKELLDRAKGLLSNEYYINVWYSAPKGE